MTKRYAIHPGIGIARVGNHPTAFFLSCEQPDGPHIEFDAMGNEVPLTKYRLDGMLKRQGVRFRVFEYEMDDNDNVVGQPSEVVDGERHVRWSVSLANRKGAARILDYRGQPAWDSDAAAEFRNKGVVGANRDTLVITNEFPVISGKGQTASPSKLGQFLTEKDIFLGELQTDVQGRLIVLGGKGHCKGPTATPGGGFADNDGWHDDTCDGSVTAKIVQDGQPDIDVEGAAWVIVAPPDFAPAVGGLITMYERAFEAGVKNRVLAIPPRPSFRDHIAPLLRRASALRWVADLGSSALQIEDSDLQKLGLKNEQDPGAAKRRGDAYKWFFDVADHISEFGQVPNIFVAFLDNWRDNDFDADFGVPPPANSATALLDRASLEQAVGGGFYPGIEAGIRLTYPEIYSKRWPFRLIASGETYSHRIDAENETVTRQLVPGHLTERMAVPWQADFLACRAQGSASAWWPSQRPDYYTTDVNAPHAELSKKWYPGNSSNWFTQEAWFARLFIKPNKSSAGSTVQVADTAD